MWKGSRREGKRGTFTRRTSAVSAGYTPSLELKETMMKISDKAFLVAVASGAFFCSLSGHASADWTATGFRGHAAVAVSNNLQGVVYYLSNTWSNEGWTACGFSAVGAYSGQSVGSCGEVQPP